MSDSDAAVIDAPEATEAPTEAPAKPTQRPEAQPDRPKLDKLPPFHVVLLNDEDHTMEYVVEMLRRVFQLKLPQAIELMWQVHRTGQAIVWTGSKEVAELKRDQVRGFGPDFYATHTVRYPLGCLIEKGE